MEHSILISPPLLIIASFLLQAQRAMAASVSVAPPGSQSMATLSNLGLNLPQRPTSPGRNTEAQLIKRVRELEEELRSARVENEKQAGSSVHWIWCLLIQSILQRAMIAKFRERWERLKESAKRKKNARVTENADMSVRERIDEEHEAEAAATAADD